MYCLGEGGKIITRDCTILSKGEELNGILYNAYIIHFLYHLSDKIVVIRNYAKEDNMHNNYRMPYKQLEIILNPVIYHSKDSMDDEWKSNEDLCR